MLKVLAFLTKKDRIERDACIDYYENHHLPLINGLTPPPAVYKRSYLMHGDLFNREDGSIDFDVVTELVFIDRGGVLRAPAGGARDPVQHPLG